VLGYPELQDSRNLLGDRAFAIFGHRTRHRPHNHFRAGLAPALDERHVNVFKEGLAVDAANAVGGLDEIIAGAAGLFAAERVGKNEALGELTRAHQKPGSIDGPLTFGIHEDSHFSVLRDVGRRLRQPRMPMFHFLLIHLGRVVTGTAFSVVKWSDCTRR
jgi:hypothetical protein